MPVFPSTSTWRSSSAVASAIYRTQPSRPARERASRSGSSMLRARTRSQPPPSAPRSSTRRPTFRPSTRRWRRPIGQAQVGYCTRTTTPAWRARSTARAPSPSPPCKAPSRRFSAGRSTSVRRCLRRPQAPRALPSGIGSSPTASAACAGLASSAWKSCTPRTGRSASRAPPVSTAARHLQPRRLSAPTALRDVDRHPARDYLRRRPRRAARTARSSA